MLLRLAIPSPGRFESVRTLDVQIGGAEANVAAAAARLGLRTAWISALPANPWGERVRRELTGHGVDCSYVRMMPGGRLAVYFLEYGAAPRPIRVLYDRRHSAFTQLTADDINWTPVRQARVVHVTGITPALGPASRAITERILEEASMLSFDLNYRAALWTVDEAKAFMARVLPRARYVFLGLDEARTVLGAEYDSPEPIIAAIAQRAPGATVTLLMGEEGSLTRDKERLVRPHRRPRVEVVDPVGAGDAYVAGFLWAALRGCEIQEIVDTATVVAALKCSMWGDIALIRPEDVQDVLAGGPRIRR